MVHLFKISLQNSDMFVKEFNVDNQTITYQIREKLSGALLEPENKSPFTVNVPEGKIEFGSRFIGLQLVSLIDQTLN